MVVGVMSLNPDRCAIVLLAPLREGEALSATDTGWRTDVTPKMFNSDATATQLSTGQLTNRVELRHATYTATAYVPAGTVLSMSDFDRNLDLSTESATSCVCTA
eukprot:6743021-Prymnesium_polylepis.1